MAIVVLIADITISQCLFAGSSYLINIIKNILQMFLIKTNSKIDNFFYKYGIQIDSILSCVLFFTLAWILTQWSVYMKK